MNHKLQFSKVQKLYIKIAKVSNKHDQKRNFN